MDKSLRRSTLGASSSGGIGLSASSASLDDSFGGGGGLGSSRGAPPSSTFKMSATQSRLSFAGGAPGLGGTQARLSFAGAGVPDRRTSSFMGRGAALLKDKPAVDPRNVNSKQFVSDSVIELVQFLEDFGFNQRIAHKTLAAPTGKDFANIVSFLFRLLDPAFVMSGKMEDEVALVFKTLRYPFPLSKTALTAVGSPHTWPALLASVMWLTELLGYDSAVQEAEASDAEAATPGDDAYFWAHLTGSYEAFLAGEDDRVAAMDDEVIKAYDAKHSQVEQEIARLQAANAALRRELDDSRAVESSLPALRGKVDELRRGIVGLTNQVRDGERERESMHARIVDLKAACEAKEADVAAAANTLASLTRRVEAQELSPAEAEALMGRKTLLRDSLARLTSEATALAQETFKLEVAVKKGIETLNTRLGEYSSQCSRLQLLPPGSKYSFGVDFTLRLSETYLRSVTATADAAGHELDDDGDEAMARGGGGKAAVGAASAATTSALLGQDMKNVVKRQLRELRAKMQRQTAEHTKALMETGDAIGSLADDKAQAQRTLELLGRKLKSHEETLAMLRGQVDAQVEGAETEVSHLQEKLQQARAELAAANAAARELGPEMLRGLQISINSHLASLESQRRRVSEVMTAAMLAVAKHKDAVQERLETFKTRVAARRDALATAPKASSAPLPSAAGGAAAALAASSVGGAPATASAASAGTGAASAGGLLGASSAFSFSQAPSVQAPAAPSGPGPATQFLAGRMTIGGAFGGFGGGVAGASGGGGYGGGYFGGGGGGFGGGGAEAGGFGRASVYGNVGASLWATQGARAGATGGFSQ